MGKKETSFASAGKYDEQKNAQSSIKGLINNEGAFIPSGLDMIENLKKVTNGMNPTAINSVGVQNFMQAIQALKDLFQKDKKKDDYNPCAIPEDQRTPQEQYDCEIQMAIAKALETVNTEINSTS